MNINALMNNLKKVDWFVVFYEEYTLHVNEIGVNKAKNGNKLTNDIIKSENIEGYPIRKNINIYDNNLILLLYFTII